MQHQAVYHFSDYNGGCLSYDRHLLWFAPCSKPCKLRYFGGTYCFHFHGDWTGTTNGEYRTVHVLNPHSKNTFTLPTHVVKSSRNYGCSLVFVFEQCAWWTVHRRKMKTDEMFLLALLGQVSCNWLAHNSWWRRLLISKIEETIKILLLVVCCNTGVRTTDNHCWAYQVLRQDGDTRECSLQRPSFICSHHYFTTTGWWLEVFMYNECVFYGRSQKQ